jgi:hypothetical protein
VSRAREDGDPGIGPDESFDIVEDLLDPTCRRSHEGESEGGPLTKVVVVHFGARDSESSSGGLEEVADHGALLLEGAATCIVRCIKTGTTVASR